MRIISPIKVADAALVSNVAEDDAPAWAAGSYNVADEAVYLHRVYRAAATTTDRPDIGAMADPPTWIDLGSTNRWRMFDDVIGQPTAKSGDIEVSLTPGVVMNGLAFFGLLGSMLHIVVHDPVEGLVYERSEPLQDNAAIRDWFAYFFEPIEYRQDIVIIDLPNYRLATTTITISGSETACGELVAGAQRLLGYAKYGTSVGIIDYSKKTVDQWGGISVTPRGFAKKADFDVGVETADVFSVQRALAAIRARPVVFIGNTEHPETVVYGFFRDFRIVISRPSISDCTIEVEGLV